MLQLPAELQRHCVQYLDVQALKALRLVNKTLSSPAHEALFGTVNVLPTDSSVAKYDSILNSEKVRALVRKVVFSTCLDPDALEFDHRDWDGSPAEIPDCLRSALGQLDGFGNLKEAGLVFSRLCAAPADEDFWQEEVLETVEFRTSMLLLFFQAVGEVGGLDSLTIKNLQDWTEADVYESESFERVREKLKKLALQVATERNEAAPEHEISLPGRHQFFTRDLKARWLLPLQEQLTCLTVYATECYWGVWPFCDLRGVKFPKLKSLSLGMWSIAHEWQIDFLLAHGETLEELVLDDCPIVVALCLDKEQCDANWSDCEPRGRDNDPIFIKHIDMRWDAVLARFQKDLGKLRHFAMGRGDWDEQKMFEERYELLSVLELSRYVVYDTGIGPSQWIGCEEAKFYKFDFGEGELEIRFPDDEADLIALGGLVRGVEERGRGKL